MLTLCHGPELTELADHLLKTLQQKPLENPLAAERFVVNNYGMQRWLTTYGAVDTGIVANWEFYFLAEQMWDLFRLMDNNIPEDLPSECEPMTWSLMHILNTHPDEPEFAVLHRYINTGDPEVRMLRSWKLCRNIARTYDQYQVFRPDMLLQWEEGKLTTDDVSERWQARLWQELITCWKSKMEEPEWLHRAQIQKKLIDNLDKGKMTNSLLPERIVIFGVPCMPPAYIKTFVKLSKQIDVYVYLLDDVYFNDDNPLVVSLGKEGKDYQYYWDKYIREDPQVECERHTFSYKDQPPKGDLLLDHIRRDMVRPEHEQAPEASKDYSVQVHSCHSPMREVEVLYDQLLALLDKDENLTPSDILIITPDIETYAPMIDAVFGTTEDGLPEIPYTISDRGSTICGPLTASFIKLMQLLSSRFKVTNIIELLGLEPIQEAFGFSDEDLNRLERWIKENRIRWGIDGKFKKSLSLPVTKGFTWSAGLDRMMAGYAMKQEGDQLFKGIYPYHEIENFDDVELLGSFTKLMRTLFEFHISINEQRSLEDWSKLMRTLADQFMPDTKAWFWELSQLRDCLKKMAQQAQLIGFSEKLPYRIVRSHLEQKLSEQSRNGGIMGRGITFSSLAPMRSIPFKVIGMIGMNDGAFPCLDVPVEFDLMNKYPRRGDRSRKDGDRHLFLENLLCTGQTIYYSYVGQSNRQDAEFSPSVVIQELLDYIENRFKVPADALTVRHRLQAFSPGYFTEPGFSQGLFSYSALQEEIATGLTKRQHAQKLFLTATLPEPESDRKKLSVRDLIRFYQHPARFLMRNRLSVYLEEEEVSTEDREPFYLTGLEGYQLGQELLERYLKGRNPASFKDVAKAIDLLPQGWPGEEAFQAKLAEVQQFGRNLTQVLDKDILDPAEVDIQVEGYRLTGRLDQLFNSGLILYRFGRARATDLIDLWIRHLILQIVDIPGQAGHSQLLARDKRQPFVRFELLPLDRDEALSIFTSLLDDYWYGLSHPFYFFPDCSYTYAEEVIHKKKDPSKALKKAAYQWRGGFGGYKKEGDDPYNHRVFGHGNPLETEAFSSRAKAFWTPFFEALNEGNS